MTVDLAAHAQLAEVRAHAIAWTNDWLLSGADGETAGEISAVLELAGAVYLVTHEPDRIALEVGRRMTSGNYDLGRFDAEESAYLDSFSTLAGALAGAVDDAAGRSA